MPTEINGFRLEEIRAIIDLCSQLGLVSEISLGELRIVFRDDLSKRDGRRQGTLHEHSVGAGSPWPLMPQAKDLVPLVDKVLDEDAQLLGLTDEQKADIKESLQQEMFVNDPLAYEQAQIDACMLLPTPNEDDE